MNLAFYLLYLLYDSQIRKIHSPHFASGPYRQRSWRRNYHHSLDTWRRDCHVNLTVNFPTRTVGARSSPLWPTGTGWNPGSGRSRAVYSPKQNVDIQDCPKRVGLISHYQLITDIVASFGFVKSEVALGQFPLNDSITREHSFKLYKQLSNQPNIFSLKFSLQVSVIYGT